MGPAILQAPVLGSALGNVRAWLGLRLGGFPWFARRRTDISIAVGQPSRIIRSRRTSFWSGWHGISPYNGSGDVFLVLAISGSYGLGLSVQTVVALVRLGPFRDVGAAQRGGVFLKPRRERREDISRTRQLYFQLLNKPPRR